MKNLQFIPIYILCLMACCTQGKEDNIIISGHFVGNTRYANLVVKNFLLGSQNTAFATITDEKFRISLPSDVLPGVYRLQYSRQNVNDYIDVIINGKEKNITFELLVSETNIGLPVFTASNQNIAWYAYKRRQNLMLTKIESLFYFLSNYPETQDQIFIEAAQVLKQQKGAFNSHFLEYSSQYKGSWVGHMIKNRPIRFSNYKDLPVLQQYYNQQRYWEDINTTAPPLINSPLFTEHILGYLSYYINPKMGFTKEEQNEGIIKSVDTIVKKFGGNKETKAFALKYLQMGFKEIGNEQVLEYIDKTYASEIAQCTQTNNDVLAYENRMAGYKALKKGKIAPNITLTDHANNSINLKDIKNERKVVVFWASWCGHCRTEIPKLHALYPSLKKEGIAVVAVALDTDKEAYKAATKNHQWFSYCDFKKWESKPALDYFIMATPTYFILDKNNQILNKVTSVEELKSQLSIVMD